MAILGWGAMAFCLFASRVFSEDHKLCKRLIMRGVCEFDIDLMTDICPGHCSNKDSDDSEIPADSEFEDAPEESEDEHEMFDESQNHVFRPVNYHEGSFSSELRSKGMSVSPRLEGRGWETINTVNNWHFAMLNDKPRNDMFKAALKKVVHPGKTTVLDLGAGSGLFSLIAARLGAKAVYAVEASEELTTVAKRIALDNGLAENITFITAMSNELEVGAGKSLREKADVLVTEILGTHLLSEGAATYVGHAREHLISPTATIIPRRGIQYVTLIQSAELAQLSEIYEWDGLNLSGFNTFSDTDQLAFINAWGTIRMNNLNYKRLTTQVALFEVDFTSVTESQLREDRSQLFEVEIIEDGIIHAALTFWHAFLDEEGNIVISTDPDHTKDNMPRDKAWGQGIQLLEDTTAEAGYLEPPKRMMVRKGDVVNLTVSFSNMRASMQFRLSALASCKKDGDGT